MGATPFDPSVQEFSLGSNLLLAVLAYAKVNRDGHLVVKLEWALEATCQATGRIQRHEYLHYKDTWLAVDCRTFRKRSFRESYPNRREAVLRFV